MRLYDDLLTNGYYTTRLHIGTPPQEFALIVDSGSTVTYVPCSTCEHCGIHQDPRFQPDSSSTYKPVKCDIDCNSCDRVRNQCAYERQYAEQSSSSGVLGEDIASFGAESTLKPQRVIFGCENDETGDLFRQRADGIMGLGRGQLSIIDQLVSKGAISDSFSLCYGGMGVGGGAMVLGALHSSSGMVFSHSDPNRSPYYNLDLKEIHVSGKRLPLNPRVFDGKHGTILDSGTTYAYLPEAAFVAFKDAVVRGLHHLKQIPGPEPKFKDICFSGSGRDSNELSKSFPKVDMVFGNGQSISLAPENYLFRHSKVNGAYCLGFFKNAETTTLLGGIIVRNMLVTYDRKNNQIGFLKTNCSQLLSGLNSNGSPLPAPSHDLGTNLSTIPSPAPSPAAVKSHFAPGQFNIGSISFDLYININFSDMIPYVGELSSLIAHDLEVNVSQVHMQNFKSAGNGSLVRWIISPTGSTEYFSEETARGIISRLANHQVHLPESFGNYQLINWNFEPQSKRAFWRRHIFALSIGVLVVVVFSFSISFLWYLHRRNQKLNAYRPVNVIIPEQELQPLEESNLAPTR